MIAIIETGGKQYIVTPEQTLKFEKIDGDKGETMAFDKVLLVASSDRVHIGKPYVAGAKVWGTIVGHAKDKKVRVVKYRAKSRYRRVRGHRQQFTTVKISKIEV